MAVTWRRLVLESDSNWVDLTDGGETTLHTHALPKLDDLAAPDDNTDLNVSTSVHGLAPKAVAPSSPTLNYLGIANGETASTWKAASSNPGAAASVLQTDASGYVQVVRLGAGVTPSYPLDVYATSMRLVGESANVFSLIDVYSNTASQGSYVFARRARGSLSSSSAVQSGDTLGGFAMSGHNGGSMLTTGQALIAGQASENWSASPAYRGTRMLFYTTPTGSATIGLKMTLENDGNLGLGASPAISDGVGLHIAGKILRLATSKTPTSGGTGNVGEICWDTSYLYVCTAANTWKRVALTGGY